MHNGYADVSAFIDGTETAYIAAVPGVHPEFRFTFQPALVEQRASYIHKAGAKEPDVGARYLAQVLLDHVKDWSFDEPITAKRLLQMKNRALTRIIDIALYGIDGGDPDPEIRHKEHAEDDALLESAIEHENYRDHLEKTKVGN